MFRNLYDRDVTTWSPEGRLYQVEYAKNSIEQGSRCLGILGKDHVVIAAYKRQPNKLGTAQKKIFKIDSHMGIVISGLTADARALAKYMRTECLNHRYYYNSAMITGRLVSDIADKSQNKTLASWKRPYGVGLLVAGVDKDGPHLYQTCPSGNLFEVNGMAIGDKSHNARTYLVQNAASFASASKDELIIHALSALKDRTSAGEDEDGNPDLSAATACVAFVGVGESFTVLENETIQPYLDRMPN